MGWVAKLAIVIATTTLVALNVDMFSSMIKLRGMSEGDRRAKAGLRNATGDTLLGPNVVRISRLQAIDSRFLTNDEIKALSSQLEASCKAVARAIVDHECTAAAMGGDKAATCNPVIEAAASGMFDAQTGRRLAGMCSGAGAKARHAMLLTVAVDSSSSRLLEELQAGRELLLVAGDLLYLPLLDPNGWDSQTFRVLLAPMPARAVCFAQLLAYEAPAPNDGRPGPGSALDVAWWYAGDASMLTDTVTSSSRA